jgi:hypothetical protein
MRKLLRREQFQALLEAMHVHDGGNKMTVLQHNMLQRSVESNQNADIFDMPRYLVVDIDAQLDSYTYIDI